MFTKGLLECFNVGTLPVVNTAHWLKWDPGQHKNKSDCTRFTQTALYAHCQTVEQHNPRFKKRRKSSKISCHLQKRPKYTERGTIASDQLNDT